MRPFRFVLIVIALCVAIIHQVRAEERVPTTKHTFINSACPGVRVTTVDTGLPQAGYWEPAMFPDMLDAARYPVVYRIQPDSEDGWTLERTMITEDTTASIGQAYLAVRIPSAAEGWRRIAKQNCFTPGPAEETATGP